jgi:hypothetical protein
MNRSGDCPPERNEIKPFDDPPDSEIDEWILPLVKVLNAQADFSTGGSCQGHANSNVHDHTYVLFMVKGLNGIRRLVEVLNEVESELESREDGIVVDAKLNWSWEFGGSTDLKANPDWVGFEVTFEDHDGNVLDGTQLLAIADAFQAYFDKDAAQVIA